MTEHAKTPQQLGAEEALRLGEEVLARAALHAAALIGQDPVVEPVGSTGFRHHRDDSASRLEAHITKVVRDMLAGGKTPEEAAEVVARIRAKG